MLPPPDPVDGHVTGVRDGVRSVRCLESFETPADDHLDKLVLLGVSAHHRSCHPAVTEDGDAVGHGEGFIEVVRHEQDARALSDASADDVEQPVPVGAGQEDSRLVEDQEPAPRVVVFGVLGQVIKRADDRQQSALHGRQVAHDRARIET